MPFVQLLFLPVLGIPSAIYMFFHLLRLYDMAHTSRNDLFHKDHPLYKLRISTLITAIIGGLLNLAAIVAELDESDYIPPFVFSLVLLFLSFVFVFHDLATYGTSSSSQHSLSTPITSSTATQDAKNISSWPPKRLVIIDLIFALVFQFLFWAEFFMIVGAYHRYSYMGGRETFESYANLANLVASILHGVAFWKELMARKKQAWQKDIEADPCAYCGHVSKAPDDGTAHFPAPGVARGATDDAAEPSKRLAGSKITLPKWARGPNTNRFTDDGDDEVKYPGIEATDEQSILVTPDESTTGVAGPSGTHQGYGTMAQSVESIGSVPETVVKKKDKGKKRLVEVD